jgi:hypothetical protein
VNDGPTRFAGLGLSGSFFIMVCFGGSIWLGTLVDRKTKNWRLGLIAGLSALAVSFTGATLLNLYVLKDLGL